jgi:hypothetical protein
LRNREPTDEHDPAGKKARTLISMHGVERDQLREVGRAEFFDANTSMFDGLRQANDISNPIPH